MTGKKGFWTKLIIFALLFALCLAGSLATGKAALKTVPGGTVFTGGNAAFSVLEEAPLPGMERLCAVSRAKGYAGSVTDPAKFASVSIVRTDSAYGDTFTLKLTEGTFFHTDAQTMRNGQDAVISDRLAVTLFAAERDVVGRRFLLNGKELLVVGVYETKRDILSRLGSDGADTVYVPWYSDAAPADTAQEVWIPEMEYGLRTRLMERLDGALDFWQETDMEMQRKLILQKGNMTLFFCGLAGSVFLVWVLYRCVKRDVLYLRQQIPEKRWWAKHIALWCALAIGAVLLILLTRFDIVLPYELTETNILRPGFYLEWFITSVQTTRQIPLGAYIGTAAVFRTAFGALAFVFLLHGLVLTGKQLKK